MTDQALTKKKANPYDQFKLAIRGDAVRERFEIILKERSEAFLSSLLSVVANDNALQKCDTGSILTAAAKAAILDLPVEKSLGFAWIVPFGKKAEFILGYKGYIQLALRTSAYEVINATPIYVGEKVIVNRLTGNITLNGKQTSDEVIGYASYFQMKNGFEKYRYMTVDEVHAHAKRYAKSYGNPKSNWTTNFDSMGLKTVIRQLLSKWGLLSIKMQDADMPLVSADNGRLTDPEDMVVPPFEDIIEGEAVDVETPTEPETEQSSHDSDYMCQAIVDAKLSVNVHAAQAALKYCTIDDPSTEEAVAWMRLYRGWKDSDKTTQEAADRANKGETP
ncbi:hypothetical protein LCGC14_2422940 [marine sediment metagenome]|uniref:Recombinase RecT n=1 Tax=marine sediment metagenome TaxID=412755 RepID=A0A0F9BP84_9ZZZZ